MRWINQSQTGTGVGNSSFISPNFLAFFPLLSPTLTFFSQFSVCHFPAVEQWPLVGYFHKRTEKMSVCIHILHSVCRTVAFWAILCSVVLVSVVPSCRNRTVGQSRRKVSVIQLPHTATVIIRYTISVLLAKTGMCKNKYISALFLERSRYLQTPEEILNGVI